MKTSQRAPSTIDEYIAGFPKDVREALQKIRTTVRRAAPGAGEAIKYRMPTFTLNGNLVHFAAFKAHIGFYPAPSGIEQFKDETAPYAGGRGTLRFPLGEPIPFRLIARIVKFRAEQNLLRKSKARPGAKGKRR